MDRRGGRWIDQLQDRYQSPPSVEDHRTKAQTHSWVMPSTLAMVETNSAWFEFSYRTWGRRLKCLQSDLRRWIKNNPLTFCSDLFSFFYFSPPARWGLLDFLRAVVLLLVLRRLLLLRLLLQFPQVCTAGPQPGTFPAQCAPLDLNLGPAQLSVRWGPAVHTELGRSQVEVQRCTLSWEGPRLRSSGAHWAGQVPGWGPAVNAR